MRNWILLMNRVMNPVIITLTPGESASKYSLDALLLFIARLQWLRIRIVT